MGNYLSQGYEACQTAAKRHSPNKMRLKERNIIQDLNRSIKDKSQSLKKWVEELDRDVEVVMSLINEKEEKIKKLESRNRSLAHINRKLGTNRNNAIKVFQHQDDKPGPALQSRESNEQANVIQARRKEPHLSTKKPGSHLARTNSDTETMIRDPAEQSENIRGVPVQYQITPKLPEGNERMSAEDLLIRPKQAKLSDYLSDPLKLLHAVLLCVGLCTVFILLYTYFFNNNFIVNSLLLLLNDQDLAELIQFFSPCLTWKNNGLMPF
ncbi:uncharacterized protein LOC128416552 [Podarcis raffonei]|uniref:uncharacterized protein LOC128416552 n=1 Tax=Podarcis raffonei TaxID=65483 RepID=UPI0023295893|nr:uncharacterized protein LOC128416552 [Podarcis raffonei]XP_053250450.1 uncharacterized protein LOC128416552 [Podarcis raffonei]